MSVSVIKEESFENAEQESDQGTKQREPEREVPFGCELSASACAQTRRGAASLRPDWQFNFGFHCKVSVFLFNVPSPLLTRRAIFP